ncbi:MAG TPA: sugar transferase [Candidatus Limnocylindria bacterium]|nr:sugar transferase [Candidatus Limnocylindria bacterium]
MKNNASLAYSLLLIIGDFLALLAAFTAAYVWRVKYDPRPLIEQIAALDYFYAVATVLPLWIVVHAFIGLYSQEVFEKRFAELGRLLVGSFMGILVLIGYDFITQAELFPARLVPVYGLGLGFSFLILFRTLVKIVRQVLFRYGIGISNVVIVGDTEASADMAGAVKNTRNTGQKVLCVVGREVTGFKYYKTFAEATSRLRRPIHAIIQTELYSNQDRNNEILRYAHEHHASYRFVPGNTDLFVGNITVDLYAGLPVVAVHQTALIGWGRIVKRLFDLAVSALLLIVLSPVFLLLALAQKIMDPKSPIFFTQTRLTRYNREYPCYKFRTLIPKYNGMLPEEGFAAMGKPELAKEFRSNGDFLIRDPRISWLGRFMRKFSLDELPQLFNVLKGDISLVGPRTLVPRELNAYEKKHAILSVKAGITGLAQVSGRKDIDFDERRRLDIYYVQNWSFWNDLTILLKTLRKIVTNNSN